jgi:hypothetical protein
MIPVNGPPLCYDTISENWLSPLMFPSFCNTVLACCSLKRLAVDLRRAAEQQQQRNDKDCRLYARYQQDSRVIKLKFIANLGLHEQLQVTRTPNQHMLAAHWQHVMSAARLPLPLRIAPLSHVLGTLHRGGSHIAKFTPRAVPSPAISVLL